MTGLNMDPSYWCVFFILTSCVWSQELTTTSDSCDVIVDLVFAIDDSGSICDKDPVNPDDRPCGNWILMVNFIKDIISQFNVDDGSTRVGLIKFSSGAKVMWNLDAYRTKSQVLSRTENLTSQYEGSETWTDHAISLLQKDTVFFFNGPGARRNATHIALIITDGKPNPQEHQNRTIELSRLAQDKGIHMFAVGVTNAIDTEILQALSSPPKQLGRNYFTSPDFSALTEITTFVARQACNVAKQTMLELSTQEVTTPTPLPLEGAPTVSSVFPLHGPLVGGTVVTVIGRYLERVVRISIGRLSTNILFRNDSLVHFSTSPEIADNLYLCQQILLYYNQNRNKIAAESFTYRPNPEISTIDPLQSVIGGGVTLTVEGSYFDSVSSRLMNLTVIKDGTHYTAGEPCHNVSSARMMCRTPKMNFREETSNAKDAFVGFTMDGVTKWRNVTANLPEYGKVSFLKDPIFYTGDVYHIQDAMYLEIEGEDISHIPIGEYKVEIGSVLCEIADIKDNLLTCQPLHREPPEKKETDADLPDNERRIIVYAGNSLVFDVGIARYHMDFDLLLVLPIATGIALMIIIFVNIVVCVLYHRSLNVKKSESSLPDTGPY